MVIVEHHAVRPFGHRYHVEEHHVHAQPAQATHAPGIDRLIFKPEHDIANAFLVEAKQCVLWTLAARNLLEQHQRIVLLGRLLKMVDKRAEEHVLRGRQYRNQVNGYRTRLRRQHNTVAATLLAFDDAFRFE